MYYYYLLPPVLGVLLIVTIIAHVALAVWVLKISPFVSMVFVGFSRSFIFLVQMT